MTDLLKGKCAGIVGKRSPSFWEKRKIIGI